MSMKNSSDTIGNPTCSVVPQPTAPPRAPLMLVSHVYHSVYFTNVNNLRIFERLLVNFTNYCYSSDVCMQPCYKEEINFYNRLYPPNFVFPQGCFNDILELTTRINLPALLRPQINERLYIFRSYTSSVLSNL